LRSVEPEGVAATEWARNVLKPDNRVAADRTNRLLMGSYGLQYTVTGSSDVLPIADLYYSTSVNAQVREIIRRGRIRYLVIDLRLSKSLPVLGSYIEGEQPIFTSRPEKLTEAQLRKFDLVTD